MEELEKVFEELKFTGVKTYIQSRNVIFYDHETNKTIVKEKLKRHYSKNYKIR
jgi:uncharacterized protein (DUF1697 family)